MAKIEMGKMQRFHLAVFSILLLKLPISFVSANGGDESSLSIENYDIIDDEPQHSNDPQISTRQVNSDIPSITEILALMKKGPEDDLLRYIKLINGLSTRLTSVHDSILELLRSASEKHLPNSPGSDKLNANTTQSSFGTVNGNGWSLETISQANRLAEEELTVVYNMLGRAFLTSSNESSTNSRPRPVTRAAPPRPVPTDYSSILRNCGGALSSGKGSISYQYNETQSANCLWVISSRFHRDYLRFTLQGALLRGNGDTNLSIGYFSNNHFDRKDTLIWKKFDLDSASGDITMDIPSVVAFVHLTSTPGRTRSSSKGFTLNFQGIYNNSTESSLRFTSSFENRLNVTFTPTIPGSNGTTYAPRQRTVLALQPPSSNAYLFIKWYDIQSKDSINGTMYDSLNIWTLKPNLQWHRIDQLQGKLNTQGNATYARKYYFNNDPPLSPIILAFQTDQSAERAGFEGYVGESSVLDSQIRLFVARAQAGRNNYWRLQGNACISVESFLRRGEGFKSVDTYGTCVKVCDGRNCTGKCQRLAPGTKVHWNLDEIQLSNRVKSIQACI